MMPTDLNRFKFCEKETHCSNKLRWACFNKECVSKGLICEFCIEDHFSHNPVSLAKLIVNLRESHKDLNLLVSYKKQSLKTIISEIHQALDKIEKNLLSLDIIVLEKFWDDLSKLNFSSKEELDKAFKTVLSLREADNKIQNLNIITNYDESLKSLTKLLELFNEFLKNQNIKITNTSYDNTKTELDKLMFNKLEKI